jgi:rare lipoprotein A
MVEVAAEFPTIKSSGRLSGRWISLAALVCCAAIFVTGCGGRQPVASAPPVTNTTPEPAPAPPEATNRPAPSSPGAAAPKPHEGGNVYEEGKASWYGAPFHGRQASNGETYDMYKFTAAHRTLPFNTMVRVTNTTNGKSTTVRITDRGPFVDNRIIDLSYAAAKQIESIGPGVVTVQLEILSAIDPNDGTFTIQVGAFHDRGNAERLQRRLKAAYPSVEIQSFE